MNMRKALPLLVIASMMLSLIPSVLATPSTSLSVAVGPVGTSVTVSGTIDTYGGNYEVYFDIDGSGTYILAERVATGTATGYSYSKTFKIPDTTAGAKRIWILDLSSVLSTSAFFTVQTKWYLSTDVSTQYEGGPVVFNATITGGDAAWGGAIDLRFRVKDPSATTIVAATYTNIAAGGTPGKYTQLHTVLGANATYSPWGVYTLYVDWDTAAVFPLANRAVASSTFEIRMTNKASYGRTSNVNIRARVPAGGAAAATTDVVDPNGVVTTYATVAAAGAFIAVTTHPTAKNSALGAYTVKLKDGAGNVLKTTTFALTPAAFTVGYIAGDYDYGGTVFTVVNEAVTRTTTLHWKFTLTYPGGGIATSADIPAGFKVYVFYNKTQVAEIPIDPLTAFNVGTNKWEISWKAPKDAVLGKNYGFNVTAGSITDQYGNVGPSNYKSTGSTFFWTVVKATITVSTPTIAYPAALATLSRTLQSKATFQATYPDGTKVTGSDISQINGTIATGAGGKTYTINMSAADYSADTGLWIIKWNIPYNAPLQADYRYRVIANNVVDKWGNKGPVGDVVAPAGNDFTVGVATIAVSGVTVDKTNVQSDEQLTISFTATYPSGASVTTRNTTGPWVTLYDGSGASITMKRAAYSSVTGKWSVAWIVPAGSTSGTYNATVRVGSVTDDATNTGPTVKKYTNFDVSRVSLTDVLASSEAAQASAELAQTKADAAKTAADTAKTAADAAKTAADAAKTAATAAQTTAGEAKTAATAAGTAANAAKTSADAATAAATSAGTKADAAKTAADGAKTAADSAAAAANGLTTLVYAAIGASLIAALAAIVALMQISRKIA